MSQRQFPIDGEVVLDESLSYEECFNLFLFLNREDFDRVGAWIDVMVEAYNEVQNIREDYVDKTGH